MGWKVACAKSDEHLKLAGRAAAVEQDAFADFRVVGDQKRTTNALNVSGTYGSTGVLNQSRFRYLI